MKRSFLLETVRHNWHLLLVFSVCVSAVALFAGRGANDAADEAISETGRGTPEVPSPAMPTQKRLTPAEEAARVIAEHQAELRLDPQSDRAPALLLSIGNLYFQKLQEYDQAISSYERAIAEYPEWEGIQKAYVQLGSAYEKDGQSEKAKSVYEEMMRRFTPDSVAYDYAKKQLGSVAEAP